MSPEAGPSRTRSSQTETLEHRRPPTLTVGPNPPFSFSNSRMELPQKVLDSDCFLQGVGRAKMGHLVLLRGLVGRRSGDLREVIPEVNSLRQSQKSTNSVKVNVTLWLNPVNSLNSAIELTFVNVPYTLHPAPISPYTLHPLPYTLLALHPTPDTLHPTPFSLHPTHFSPYTLHPSHHPTPYTLQHVLPLEIARHPILKVTCKHFALSWSHC